MRIVRILFLIVFGWASLTMSAKNNIYGNKTEQRAIKMAYTLLQVYYPLIPQHYNLTLFISS